MVQTQAWDWIIISPTLPAPEAVCMAVLSLAVLHPLLRELQMTEAQLVAQSDDPEVLAGLFHRQRELDRLQLNIDGIETAHPLQGSGHGRLGVELLDQELVFVTHDADIDALVAQGRVSSLDADWLKNELVQHLAQIPAQSAYESISTLRRRELRLGRRQDRALRRYLLAPIRDPSAIVLRLLVLLATLEPDLTASALRSVIRAIGLPRSIK